jgi:hypothetical protein
MSDNNGCCEATNGAWRCELPAGHHGTHGAWLSWETIPDQPAADIRCTATNDQGCRCDRRAGHAERVHHHAGDYWRTPEPDHCPATTTLGWVCILPSGHEDAHRHRDDDGADFLWMTTDPDVSDRLAALEANQRAIESRMRTTVLRDMGGSIAAIRQRCNNHDEAIRDLRTQVAPTAAEIEELRTNHHGLSRRIAAIADATLAIQELRDQVAWLTSRVEDIPPGQAIRDTMADVRNANQARADAYAEMADLIAGNFARCKWFRDADGTIYVGTEGLLAELQARAARP